MDPRYESPERAVLTKLIIFINHYIQYHIDDMLTNAIIHHEITDICKTIYHFMGMDVEVDIVLSKHNLLSIDMVLFPHFNDIEESRFHHPHDFNNLISKIRLHIADENNHKNELNKYINDILNSYVSSIS